MSLSDFEAREEHIDLTRLDFSHLPSTKKSSLQTASSSITAFNSVKKMKMENLPLLEQHEKEKAILEFINEDRSGKVEMILRNAGVIEEQYVQFPFNELYVNPARLDLDLDDPSRCKYIVLFLLLLLSTFAYYYHHHVNNNYPVRNNYAIIK
jgi:hypothetical protein